MRLDGKWQTTDGAARKGWRESSTGGGPIQSVGFHAAADTSMPRATAMDRSSGTRRPNLAFMAPTRGDLFGCVGPDAEFIQADVMTRFALPSAQKAGPSQVGVVVGAQKQAVANKTHAQFFTHR